jgi:hypothetical protein
VAPSAVDGDRLAKLSDEVDAAIQAAGPRNPAGGGIVGHYVAAAGRPVSAALVRRFHPLAEQLLGRACFPAAPFEILFFAAAGWHVDVGPDTPALKVAIYLETLDANTGALRVLPTSHLVPQTQLRPLQRMNPHQVPCHVIESAPGDLIAFHTHLWHASLNGRDRRQWSVEYFAWPHDERERSELRQLRKEWLNEPEWGPAYGGDVQRLREADVL